MKALWVVPSLALLLGGCASAPAPVSAATPEAPDELCAAMKQFAESAPPGRHEVTLLTDWGAEPTKACRRADAPPERALCGYLMENTSIEFMSSNIERALSCLGVINPSARENLHFTLVAGSFTTTQPPFTSRPVEVEIDFDGTSNDGLPHLTIAVTPASQ